MDTKEVAYDRFRLLLQAVVKEEEVRDRTVDTSNTWPKAAAGRLQGYDDDKEEGDHEKNCCLHWSHGSL